MDSTETDSFPEGGVSMPVTLRLKDRLVLIIGNGHVALMRVRGALEADARVRIIAPSLSPELASLLQNPKGRITWLPRNLSRLVDVPPSSSCGVPTIPGEPIQLPPVSTEDLQDAHIVLSTIDDEVFSRSIAHFCRDQKIWVSCADMPDMCDFWMTSVYRDGPLQISVSSNGSGPRLAIRIKEYIARSLPEKAGEAIAKVGLLRQLVRHVSPDKADSARRMKWLSSLCDSLSFEQLANLADDDISSLMSQYVTERAPHRPVKGSIALIGCGPGDPDLLTVKAVKYIQAADVILADVLVSMEVLKYASPKAEIYVAEKRDCGQDEGQSRLFVLALQALSRGKSVARLKGGDVYIFGRGGEEVLFFRKYGYEPMVIPGISTIIGAPSATTVPLTYRNISDQVLVLSAVGAAGSWPSHIPDYASNRTLIILMVVNRLEKMTKDYLIDQYRYPSDCPAVIVENATLPTQRQIFSSLDSIAALAAEQKIKSPATLIVGWTASPSLLSEIDHTTIEKTIV